MDLTLVLADGSMGGKADPAFAAHEAPITKWAEAVWESWLPRADLAKLAAAAVEALAGRPSPWAMVRGPAGAFVASAQRLGWRVQSSTEVYTDLGQVIDFTRDSPAMAQRFVQQSVWRWRWRRVEARHPHLVQGAGGHGLSTLQALRRLGRRRLECCLEGRPEVGVRESPVAPGAASPSGPRPHSQLQAVRAGGAVRPL